MHFKKNYLLESIANSNVIVIVYCYSCKELNIQKNHLNKYNAISKWKQSRSL